MERFLKRFFGSVGCRRGCVTQNARNGVVRLGKAVVVAVVVVKGGTSNRAGPRNVARLARFKVELGALIVKKEMSVLYGQSGRRNVVKQEILTTKPVPV